MSAHVQISRCFGAIHARVSTTLAVLILPEFRLKRPVLVVAEIIDFLCEYAIIQTSEMIGCRTFTPPTISLQGL